LPIRTLPRALALLWMYARLAVFCLMFIGHGRFCPMPERGNPRLQRQLSPCGLGR
jgi:hypothetical protein